MRSEQNQNGKQAATLPPIISKLRANNSQLLNFLNPNPNADVLITLTITLRRETAEHQRFERNNDRIKANQLAAITNKGRQA